MLGQRIRERRKAKKMTQQNLADMLKLAKSTISQYETGVNEPDSETLVRLARILDTTTDYLLGLTDNPTPPGEKPAIDPDLEQDIPDFTPEEIEFLNRLKKEVAFKNYLEAPEEAKKSLIEAVKLLMRGVQKPKEGRSMYVVKKFQINQDGSKEEVEAYWDPNLNQPRIFPDRGAAQNTADTLNNSLPSDSAFRWEVVAVQL
ncbi:MAG TPA: helix-turn-helix domain-containing protein [Alicyclobacillus sp.]|nr:helix-turn-helix domain-containing protein [Alicyclobacillus sp.]